MRGFGVVLLATNRWFTAVDDECAIIDHATKPALETIRLYTRGIGEHEHPPLYDLLLSPFGFHFGRLACFYSFSFLLVSLLTLTYFKYLKKRNKRNWLWVFLCSLALLYTSYFGWAILACLVYAIDSATRVANQSETICVSVAGWT